MQLCIQKLKFLLNLTQKKLQKIPIVFLQILFSRAVTQINTTKMPHNRAAVSTKEVPM